MSDDIVKYYRMKAAYEDKLAKKKRSIMADPTLDQQEKRRRVARVTANCPTCKKPGGVIFSRRGTQLTAVCGASPSCQFSMVVERGNYKNVRESEAAAVDNMRRLESEVIRAKLNLLFGFASQEEAVARFEVLRPQYKATGEELESLRKQYLGVVHRTADKDALRLAKSELALAREQLAGLDGDTPEDARKAAAVYVETIRPLVSKIRRLKYARSAVVTELRDDPMEQVDVLELAPYTLDQLIIDDQGAS